MFAALVRRASGYKGDVILDVNCYDKVDRRLLDPRQIFELGWTPATLMQNGLQETCTWYNTKLKLKL